MQTEKKQTIWGKCWGLVGLAFLTAPAMAMAPSPDGEGAAGSSQFLIMILVFFGIFYFIVIRPQQKEQKRHQARINSLKKNDRVVTSGGIHGVVRATKEKTLVLEIADGVKITINRNSVSGVVSSDSDTSNEE